MNRNAAALLVSGLVFSLCVIAGCAGVKPAEPPKGASLVRVSPKDLPSFSDDINFDGLYHAISKSLAYLNRMPADRTFSFETDEVDRDHMIRSLTTFQKFIRSRPSAEQLSGFIAENYRVYRSVGDGSNGRVLFTGYYEPILLGKTRRSDRFRQPLYAVPEDLVSANLSLFSSRFKGERIFGRVENGKMVPYYDRAAIEENHVLDGKARVLAWVEDPVDLFFLHIQGSGKIYLENGKSINVHYAGTNGRAYRSIGKYLIETGKISREEMSMQAIRQYLAEHPGQVRSILNTNPSYVFFQSEKEGPLGCLEVLLTPGRSLATDRRIFPSAALAYIETQKPLVDGNGEVQSWQDFQRFALNQDTGGAIRGPGRADLFWGNGPYASVAAGHMKQSGAMYFLVLKPES